MGEYKRLISYIYSYERGAKSKNAGFAKIESKNGICKVNISLRIADELMNEAEDNMLEVFFCYRDSGIIHKVYLDRIRIINGCSVLKLRMNSENIGNSGVDIGKITGIFICTKAFLEGNSIQNIVYASEWDDIPIKVEEFKEKEINNMLQKSTEIDYNVDNSRKEVSSENSELEASDVDKLEECSNKLVEILMEEKQRDEIHSESLDDDEEIVKDFDVEQDNDYQKESEQELEKEFAKSQGNESENKFVKSQDNESEKISVKKQDNESEKESEDGLEKYLENKMVIHSRGPAAGDYFNMLCNCYPKVKIEEINGECIKITPHDISYLPRRYWHLSNNSFLLHGYYNYKYLLLCEKIVNAERKYLVGVPGMFHQKEQKIAKMFGFTEFEGNNTDNAIQFGYWCMYL